MFSDPAASTKSNPSIKRDFFSVCKVSSACSIICAIETIHFEWDPSVRTLLV